MSSMDVAEAMAYERIEPIGEARADFRNAINCYVIARYNGAKEAKVTDFMPNFDKEQHTLSDKIKEVFKSGNPS